MTSLNTKVGRKKLYVELYKSNFSQSNRNNENLFGGRGCLTLLLNSETIKKLSLPHRQISISAAAGRASTC